jgi:hypothetical protein
MQNGTSELDALEAAQFEYSDETTASNGESPFDEIQELELAGSLLEITDEQELDRFLGDLLKRASRAVGGALPGSAGQILGGLLKGAVKKTLPTVASSLGRRIGGATGANIAGQLASTAGQIFGLELEGMSQEDQEFELARRFVRFAGSAAGRAASSGGGPAAARNAVIAAARRHAPGLLRSDDDDARTPGVASMARSGRWVRRGRQIVIMNCFGPQHPSA